MKKIKVFCFSPCGKTAVAADTIALRLSSRLGMDVVWSDYTTPSLRSQIVGIEKDDIVIWASPVYAGKTPNVMLPFVKEHLRGKGNPVVLLATFGNRSFDNALAEMSSLVRNGGMNPVAAAAVVAEHAFVPELGFCRPSADDKRELEMFADAIDFGSGINIVPGVADAPYYQPLKEDGTPAKFLKALPVVDDSKCTACGKCVTVCPVGSVSLENVAVFSSPCIKCMACVKNCPEAAISINDADFKSHRRMLLSSMSDAKENVFIV